MVDSTVNSDLVIRAKDLSSQPIKDVAEAVAKLSAALRDQAAAADKGEGSVKDFATAITQGKEALAALLAQRGMLEQFQTTLDRFGEKAEAQFAARDALEAFKATMVGIEKPTRDQARTLKDLEAAYESARKAANTANNNYNNQVAAMQRLGITAAEVTSTQKMLSQAYGDGVRAVNGAIDAQARLGTVQAENKVRAEAAAKAERDEANAIAAMAKLVADAEAEDQRRTNAHIKMLSIMAQAEAEDRQRTANAEAKAAKDSKDRAKADEDAYKARQKQRADDLSAQQALYDFEQMVNARAEAAYQQRKAEAENMARFRNLAVEAAARIPAAAPFGGAQAPSPGFSSASQDLANLLAPAAAARSSVAGVSAEVAALDNTLFRSEKTSKDYAQAMQGLAVAAAEIKRQGGLFDAFRQQEVATRAAEAAMVAQRNALEALNVQIHNSTTADATLAKEVTSVENSLRKATDEYNRQNTALAVAKANLSTVTGGYVTIDEALNKLKATAQQSADVFTRITRAQKGEGTGDGTVLFGLRPYELQNLSYQINDVITQLGSGTSVTQTFAQQGGQIFQLFQKQLVGVYQNLKTIPGLLPAIGVGLAAVTIAALAFARALELAAAQRAFAGMLAATADSSEVTSARLLGITKQVSQLGVSFTEATATVKTFLQDGINPDRILAFSKAAHDLATVYGVTLPEAAKEVAAAFTSNYDAVTKLDEKYNFLTVTQKAEIKELFDLGEAEKARTQAYDIFQGKLQTGADKARGEFTQAVTRLANSWHGLLDAFANSAVIEAVISRLGKMLDVVSALARISGIAGPTVEAAKRLLPDLNAQIATAQKELEGTPDNGSRINTSRREAAQAQITALRAQRDEYERIAGVNNTITETEQRRAGLAGVQDINAEKQRKRAADLLDELQRRFDTERQGTLRNEEAAAASARRIAEYRKKLNDEAEKKGVSPNQDPAIKAEIDRQTAAFAEAERVRLEQLPSVARSQREIEQARLQAEREGLKGHAALAADRAKIDEDITAQLQKHMRENGMTEAKAQETFGAALEKERQARYDAAQRQRDLQDKRAGDKAANAEESLQAQLLAIKSKADKADKTNLEARLRSIDEEYDKIQLVINKARRAGVTSVGGQTFQEFVAEIEAQKDKLKNDTTVTFYEETLNKLLAARKTEYAAINDELKQGTISVAEGFRRTTEVTSRLGAEIRKAASEAVEFAKKLPQTPKVAAFIAQQQRRATQSDAAAASEGADGVTAAAMEPVNKLIRERTELETAERVLAKDRLITNVQAEEKIRAAYAATTPQIQAATASIKTQLDEQLRLGNITQLTYDTWIAKLIEVNAKSKYVSDENKQLMKGIEDSFVNNALTAFNTLGSKLGEFAAGTANLKDVFQAAGQAFSQFAAGFLLDIAKMILKVQLLKLIQTGLNMISPGAGDAVAALSGAAGGLGGGAGTSTPFDGAGIPEAHTGAIIGVNDNTRRTVDPRWFANAPRYHSGGMVGLNANEQAAVLQKGEEVLSRVDPRNALNSGKAGAKPEMTSNRGIRQVLVFDQKDISQALAGSHGEQVVLTHIKNNPGVVRQLIRQ